MKLLLLTSEFPPYFGGIGVYAFELASAAAKAGHDVVVLAPNYGSDQSVTDSDLPFRVVRFSSGPPTRYGIIWRSVRAWLLMLHEKFDVIHAIDFTFFMPVRLASHLQPHARYLLTVHGTEVRLMQTPRWRVLLDLLSFWKKGWATWISNSQFTRELLLTSFPALSPSQVRATPLAVSDRWRSARIDRAKARKMYDIGPDDFVIVSVGRVVPRKGHDIVADALALLPLPISTGLQWWVIGPLLEEDHASMLKAKAMNLATKTTFFGGLASEEVQGRLCASDLFCLPGYQDDSGKVEGFGLVFLEAGAYGLPSVATLSGGIPEAVVNEESGLLVREHDPVALAHAITRLRSDPALMTRLARGAERRAAVTWHHVMQQTYEA